MRKCIIKSFVLAALLCSWLFTSGKSIQTGYEALSIFDYFKAKKVFQQNLKKYPMEAGFGLATIYHRHDNPFTNSDSALKYIRISHSSCRSKPHQFKHVGFSIDSSSIQHLHDTISLKQFARLNINNVEELENFMIQNRSASPGIIQKALMLRDEKEFRHLFEIQSSDSTQKFILTHPESHLLADAKRLMHEQVYRENTETGDINSYKTFISKYKNSPFINDALDQLYTLYCTKKDTAGLEYFIQQYPQSLLIQEAWKMLFTLKVKRYINSELDAFLKAYPEFPFKETIISEMEMNKLELLPYESNGSFGYIDESGKIRIDPVYEDAAMFSEGLALVSSGDSVIFINKKNARVFPQAFQDAYDFHGSFAPVKVQNKWRFINHHGQFINGSFDDVNALCDDIYVIRKDKMYGAINKRLDQVIECKFDELGDFRNGFARYALNGKYGFLSASGFIYRAEFDWISDFGKEQIAVFRKNGRFGLIKTNGEILLDAQWDLVQNVGHGIFMVIKQGQYGYFSSEGCFISEVAFDHQKELSAEDYTDGYTFLLMKNNEKALRDKNGTALINSGQYDDIGLLKNNRVRVKKKNKWGYLDRNMSLLGGFKYEEATDYMNDLAIVKLKDHYAAIDLKGNVVFESTQEIKRTVSGYFLTEDNGLSIYTKNGVKLEENVKNLQESGEKVLIITLANGQIKLLGL